MHEPLRIYPLKLQKNDSLKPEKLNFQKECARSNGYMHIVIDLQGGMIAFLPRMKKHCKWDRGSFLRDALCFCHGACSLGMGGINNESDGRPFYSNVNVHSIL